MSSPHKQLPFTLLVNSTDGYSDCWEPFFKLLAIYWPQYKDEVLLNAETKSIQVPGVRIKATHSAQAVNGAHPTWTESILYALDQAETDIILYVQEDYFLKDYVQHDFIVELARMMEEKKLTYIGLMDEGAHGPFTPSGFDDRLWTIGQQDKYRISLQACLFSKSRMRKYFRRHENPWHFEYYGNIRARRKKDTFYTLNRDLYSARHNSVFPYDLTGIVSRQWKRDVVERLFARHDIEIDYSIRGFYGEGPQVDRFITKKFGLSKLVSVIKSLV
jgi:hypothetical protein